MNIKPSKPVRKITHTIKLNSDVPVFVMAARNVSALDAPLADFPNKNACFWRVVQCGQQPLMREVHVCSSKQQSNKGVGKRRIKPLFGDQPSQHVALYGKESTIGLADRVAHINTALNVLTA